MQTITGNRSSEAFTERIRCRKEPDWFSLCHLTLVGAAPIDFVLWPRQRPWSTFSISLFGCSHRSRLYNDPVNGCLSQVDTTNGHNGHSLQKSRQGEERRQSLNIADQFRDGFGAGVTHGDPRAWEQRRCRNHRLHHGCHRGSHPGRHHGSHPGSFWGEDGGHSSDHPEYKVV